MPVDTKFQRALQLAKSGKLQEAQQLLLTLDTPEADRLLDKVNKAIAARGTSGTVTQSEAEVAPETKRQASVLIAALIILATCAICFIVLSIQSQPNAQASMEQVCKGVTELGFDCDPSRILSQYPNQVDYCQSLNGNWNERNKFAWEICLEENGVDFNLND